MTRIKIDKRKKQIWSFFSGAFGLDLGFEKVGLETTLALEIDKWCCETIRANRPGVAVVEESISDFTGDSLRSRTEFAGDVLLMIGGPPCQSFSSAGKRSGLSDPRGNLLYEYLRLISEVRPKFFVLENVANLITAALRHRPINERPGKQWNLRSYSNGSKRNNLDGAAPLESDEMSGSAVTQILIDVQKLGYSFQFGVLNAAWFGAPQNRMRFILMGSRDGYSPNLPSVTHGDRGTNRVRTLRDVIFDLRDSPGIHSEYEDDTKVFFNLVPPGGNWRNLPEAMQPIALGPSYESGGGKTGFFRRLDWDAPCPTVTTKPNRKGTAMCHPEATRPLSVRECARIQGFPDDWKFSGAMNQQYQQVGNAVPVHLAEAVAKKVLEAIEGKSKSGVLLSVEAMLRDASGHLRATARNKRSRSEEIQPMLF
jgi:DNA (cytosine-5)-methyltransferase 1